MDGKGRAFDKIMVERLWRTVKYEKVYLNEYSDYFEVLANIERYINFYNNEAFEPGQADTGREIPRLQKRSERISMKERIGSHSATGHALHSVAAEGRGKKSTLSREVFSLDNPGHLT